MLLWRQQVKFCSLISENKFSFPFLFTGIIMSRRCLLDKHGSGTQQTQLGREKTSTSTLSGASERDQSRRQQTVGRIQTTRQSTSHLQLCTRDGCICSSTMESEQSKMPSVRVDKQQQGQPGAGAERAAVRVRASHKNAIRSAKRR